LRLWRAERLNDASMSFFIFFSQDDIFMARAVEDFAVARAVAAAAQVSL
jgi:hypothetical protein